MAGSRANNNRVTKPSGTLRGQGTKRSTINAAAVPRALAAASNAPTASRVSAVGFFAEPMFSADLTFGSAPIEPNYILSSEPATYGTNQDLTATYGMYTPLPYVASETPEEEMIAEYERLTGTPYVRDEAYGEDPDVEMTSSPAPVVTAPAPAAEPATAPTQYPWVHANYDNMLDVEVEMRRDDLIRTLERFTGQPYVREADGTNRAPECTMASSPPPAREVIDLTRDSESEGDEDEEMEEEVHGTDPEDAKMEEQEDEDKRDARPSGDDPVAWMKWYIARQGGYFEKF